MLIGIDASRAITKQRTGTEKYSRDLIFALAKIDRKNQYRLYVGPNYDGCFGNLPQNFSVIKIDRKKLWTQIGLSLEMMKHKPDVLFVPSHVLPPITPKKTVTTIHDLAWKYFPETYPNRDIKLYDLGIRRAIKKQAKIIVYSQSTLLDMEKYYPDSSKLLNFVPMGFDSQKAEGELGEKVNEIIKKPYLLFVGRLEKKKNVVNLIKAYDLLRSERKIKHKLILVGKQGFGYSEIKDSIENSKWKSDIIETGYVADAERDLLYEKAQVFVFPSLYEGFGFPILESFASSIPVVTSKISSMPEVAGKGAILIDPTKPFEIAAAMSQIINKPELRSKLIRAGNLKVAKYSWENCARETLKVLEENAE